MATNPGTELATLDFGNLIGGPLVAAITAQSIAARSTADFIKTVGFDSNNIPIYVAFKYPKEVQPFQPAKRGRVTSVTVVAGGAGVVGPLTITFTSGTGETAATGSVTVAGGAITAVTLIDGGSYSALASAPPTANLVAGAGGNLGTGTTTLTVNYDAPSVAIPAAYQDMMFQVPILTMLPIPFIKVDIITIDFNAKISSMETRTESTDAAIAGNLQVQQRWPGGAARLNVSASYKKSTASGASVERTFSMQIHVQASQDEMPAGMEKLLNLLEGAMLSTPDGAPHPKSV